MSYQMYPARKKESIPPLRWETLQHLCLVFFSSLQLPHKGKEKQGPTQAFMQQNPDEHGTGSS